jgi:hypothetical protein
MHEYKINYMKSICYLPLVKALVKYSSGDSVNYNAGDTTNGVPNIKCNHASRNNLGSGYSFWISDQLYTVFDTAANMNTKIGTGATGAQTCDI